MPQGTMHFKLSYRDKFKQMQMLQQAINFDKVLNHQTSFLEAAK